MTDWEADYKAAQALGHHADCDGWRMHSIVPKQLDNGTYVPECPLGCVIDVTSSSGTPAEALAMADHSFSEPCDGRCREWK